MVVAILVEFIIAIVAFVEVAVVTLFLKIKLSARIGSGLTRVAQLPFCAR